VVTSNSSSLPEVVGQAGLMTPPRDTAALAQALVRLLDDEVLRQRLSRAGLEQASRFSWERAANKTQALYDEVYHRWKKQ
jgi:glycosyltransferase involved in cell wall biosynthesis